MASGSNMNVLLQNQSLSCSSNVLESLWCPNSSSTYIGSKAMVDWEKASLDKDDHSDEEYDGYFQRPQKKRRLPSDQVKFLERNFEVENKLDPERKFQLAKEIGLQPRQVAIWFQNRRARYKTKQLEKEYECLRASYDKLKEDYDNLLMDNENLKNEVHSLKDKLPIKDSRHGNQEHICHNANDSAKLEPQNLLVVAQKQEDASSAKSDVFDSDSPHYLDDKSSLFLEPAYSSNIFEQDNNSAFLEPAYSSNVFESEQSDFSQEDGDNFSKSLLQTPYFPKLEDGVCDLGLAAEDQLFCFWS